MALSSPPNSSASSAFSTFSDSPSPVTHTRFEASSRPAQFQTLLRHLNQKTPTPYQISSTPHQPQRVSSSTPASQLVPCAVFRAVSASHIPNHIFLSVSAITLRIRERIKRDTSYTPLQFIVLLEPVHQQLPDIHLPFLAEAPPL